jgi:hypothetical protein
MAFLLALPRKGEGCIAWPFARDKGIAKVWFRGRMQSAARVVCEVVHGPAPDQTAQAAHSCGNAHLGCVAPWHVAWKSPRQNQADRLVHGTHNRGERHPLVKLTAEQVRDIRVLAKSIVQRDIAAYYAIAQQTVSDIVRGKRWRENYLS